MDLHEVPLASAKAALELETYSQGGKSDFRILREIIGMLKDRSHGSLVRDRRVSSALFTALCSVGLLKLLPKPALPEFEAAIANTADELSAIVAAEHAEVDRTQKMIDLLIAFSDALAAGIHRVRAHC